MKIRPILVACSVAALAAAGCAGGGGVTMTPASQSNTQSQTSKSTLTIKIPAKTVSSSASSRTPQYISPNTNSATFTVAGGSAQLVDLSSTSGACTPASGGGRTCTATITAPVSTGESVLIKTFASADGTGTALTNNTEVLVVSANPADNNDTFTLNGVMASFTVALSSTSVTTGAPDTSLVASLTPLDASGATIIGTVVGADGNDISVTPTLTANPATGFTIGAWNDDGGTFPVSWDGTGTSTPVTFTASATGYPDATTQVTVNPAAGPLELLTDGDFEAGPSALGATETSSGWYKCYTGHTALAVSIDPNPAPSSNPEPTQSPPGTTIGQTLGDPAHDMQISSTMPAGGGSVHGGTYAAQIGQVSSPFTTVGADGREKGLNGVCQDVAVPATGSTSLTLWVYEGGNTTYLSNYDAEADIISPTAAGWAAGTATVSSASVSNAAGAMWAEASNFKTGAPLFGEANCWNNLNTSGGAISAGPCATPAPAAPGNDPSDAPGGQWREKGPYDLSSYAGQTVTLMLGVWSGSTSAGYYDYAYFDDVQMLNAP